MYYRLLILLITIGLALPAFAQKPNVLLDSKIKDKKELGQGTLGVIASNDDGYYALRANSKTYILANINNKKITLDHYNKSMDLVGSIELPEIGIGREIGNSSSYEFSAKDANGEIYLYYSTGERNGTINHLYRQKLTTSPLSIGAKELVSSYEYIERESDRRGTFGIYSSPDNSKQVIFSVAQEKDQESAKLTVQVLDNNLNPLWENTVKVPYRINRSFAKLGFSARCTFNPFIGGPHDKLLVSNNGSVKINIKAEGKYEKDHSFYLVSVTKDSKKPVTKKINLTEGEAQDLILTHDQDGGVRGFALFGEKKFGASKGITAFNIDANSLALSGFKTETFDNEERRTIQYGNNPPEVDTKKKKADRKLEYRERVYERRFLNVAIHNNGSYTLTTEGYHGYQDSKNKRYSPTHEGMTSVKHEIRVPGSWIYVFTDIVSFNFDKDGGMNWLQHIEKNQKGKFIELLSTNIQQYNDKLYYIFTARDVDKSMNLYYAVLDAEGETSEGVISKLDKKSSFENYAFGPFTAHKIKDDEVSGFAFKTSKVKALTFKLR